MESAKQVNGRSWALGVLVAGAVACGPTVGASGGPLFAEHLRRGHALFQQGNYARAHLAFQRARALVPGSEEAVMGVDLAAVALAAEGAELITDANINEIDYTLDVLEGRPGVPAHLVHTARANLLARAGKLADAVTAYRKALDQKADYTPAMLSLAQTLAQSGKGGEAEAVLRSLMRTDPKQVTGRQMLATLLVNRDSPEEAVQVLQDGIALGGGAVLQATLGLVTAKAGKTNDAENAFREALKQDPDLPPALYGLGALLFRTPRAAEAPPLLQHYLEVAQARGEPAQRIQEVRAALEQVQGPGGAPGSVPAAPRPGGK